MLAVSRTSSGREDEKEMQEGRANPIPPSVPARAIVFSPGTGLVMSPGLAPMNRAGMTLQQFQEDAWVFVKLHYMIGRVLFYFRSEGVAKKVGIVSYISFFVGSLGMIGLNAFAIFALESDPGHRVALGFDAVFCLLLLLLAVKFFISFLNHTRERPSLEVMHTVVTIFHLALLIFLMASLRINSTGYIISAVLLSLLNVHVLVGIFVLTNFAVDLVLLFFEFLVRLVLCKLTNPCFGLLTTRVRLSIEDKRATAPQLGPGTPYKASMAEQTKCTICLSDFEDGQTVCYLRCHATHVFHKKCLEAWAQNSSACPMCRTRIQCNS